MGVVFTCYVMIADFGWVWFGVDVGGGSFWDIVLLLGCGVGWFVVVWLLF